MDKDLVQARQEYQRVEHEVRTVIRIMSAEQALLAQKVVREAGRREHKP